MPPPTLSGCLDISRSVVKPPQECPVTKTCFLGTPAFTNFSVISKFNSTHLSNICLPL